MLDGEPESRRRAIIEDIDRIAVEADDFGEAVDHVRDLVEACSRAPACPIAEAGQVGRDDVEAIGQKRDQIAEHVARARKAMQQQQLRRIRRSRPRDRRS